jgi:hypothetical protein
VVPDAGAVICPSVVVVAAVVMLAASVSGARHWMRVPAIDAVAA